MSKKKKKKKSWEKASLFEGVDVWRGPATHQPTHRCCCRVVVVEELHQGQHDTEDECAFITIISLREYSDSVSYW